MKNQINALLISDLKNIIPNEEPKYLIKKKDNGYYEINPIPVFFKDNIKNILNNLAYDFDTLKISNQILYQEHIKKYVLMENNEYKLDTKIYKMKKRK